MILDVESRKPKNSIKQFSQSHTLCAGVTKLEGTMAMTVIAEDLAVRDVGDLITVELPGVQRATTSGQASDRGSERSSTAELDDPEGEDNEKDDEGDDDDEDDVEDNDEDDAEDADDDTDSERS